MCGFRDDLTERQKSHKKIPVAEAVGLKLAHDITEIRPGEIKCRAYKRGHIVRQDDIEHFLRLGKENIFVLNIEKDEMHEDDAAYCLANALMGNGVTMEGEPKEGKINIIAERDGLLKVNKEALFLFNMTGDVMCATLHNNTPVKKGQIVAGTRLIPLVVKQKAVEEAISITSRCGKVIEIKEMRRPKAGVVITGNEVYYGRIKDAFAPVITAKIEEYEGEIVGLSYTPDDEGMITDKLNEFIEEGADLLITTGGMSVDPDDVTRFAIRNLGATDISYGSAVLPGAMFLIAYVKSPDVRDGTIPVLGIPACGIYHKITIFDLILPRVLTGEKITRKELAELGHGGLCLNCKECRYPLCPFGRG
ncbi:MAG TPA: molybdopterin-binding protein [Thermodesulfobacteriota bacterium]|nr:molybdopterin-binding protein [Thermodesulfobacteriota bacterium]